MSTASSDIQQPISVTVETAIAISGLSRGTIYKLINERSLQSRLKAGRRLVLFSSLKSYLEADDKAA
ncbi:putative DNA-binding transcriptional regulator AlpA [Inquilinus ginsengisoli]|uniref:helix-turn-helix domain-containing protein n=1 Tax=Inquilinus ginsengisoli TaxID=363840 RepID=UPI003D21109A